MRCLIITSRGDAAYKGKNPASLLAGTAVVSTAGGNGGQWALASVLGLSAIGSSVGGMVMGYPAMNMVAQQDAFMMMGVLGVGFVMILMIGIIAVVALRSQSHGERDTDMEAMLLESAMLQQRHESKSRRRKH